MMDHLPVPEDVLIVAASRHQPDTVEQLAGKWAGQGRLVICIAAADPTLAAYVAAAETLGVELLVGPRSTPLDNRSVIEVVDRYLDSYPMIIIDTTAASGATGAKQ